MWDIPWMGELSGYPATNPQKHQEFNVAEALLAAADEIQCQGPLEIGVALASACVSHIDSSMFHHQTSFWWLNQQQHDKTGKYGGIHGNIMG